MFTAFQDILSLSFNGLTIVITWNVRGLGKVEKRRVMRNMVDTFKPTILFLQETKPKSCDNRIVKNMGGNVLNRSINVDADGVQMKEVEAHAEPMKENETPVEPGESGVKETFIDSGVTRTKGVENTSIEGVSQEVRGKEDASFLA
ncbi:hypothetical protein LWI28_017406 [Acer negundo]|uniref:Uncharacterized protein n=1 Tax=Acer negundo TaxID=4023 RepID=A0AAD5JDE1_ACENE|nr:hypothetical protein LWI28_017406 [Acer negundo]